MEILRVDGRVARVEVGGLQQALDHQRDLAAEALLHLLEVDDLFHHGAVEQQGDDRGALQANL